jgi:putative CocE/NonD family hydrolase
MRPGIGTCDRHMGLPRRSTVPRLAGPARPVRQSEGTGAMSLTPGPWAVEELTDVFVTMRDGVRLASDVYLPAGAGPVPSLLERTPYDRRGTNHADVTLADPRPLSKPETARWFASHGFAVVLQDCRGRYGSEGTFHKYVHEGEDGDDTIAWLARQPWCDGRVGTHGLSYCAHVQAAVGCLAPPALASQFLDSGGFSSAYHSGIRQGGALELKQATWAYKHARLSPATRADPARRAALESEDIRRWFAEMPWRPGHSPVRAAPEYEAYLFEQWRRGEFDDYWRRLGLYAAGRYDAYADVPMVHMSSWYDPYSRTACENYLGLSRRKHGPVHLVLGPWTHGRRSEHWAGDVDFGTDAPFDVAFGCSFFEFRRRWFERTLRGRGEDPFAGDHVVYFMMGGGSGRRTADGRLDHGGRWCRSADWPPPEAEGRDLYLRADRRLDWAPPATSCAETLVHDPHDPVPTIGGAIASGEPVMRAGAFDQRERADFFGCRVPGRALADRPDVLAFETEPLRDDLEIVGPVVARLWISSDAPDTDVTLKLVDVHPPGADYPQGYAMNLTHGILRLRYRESWTHARLLNRDEVYAVEVEAFPVANRFVRGHRIRIEIAGSNYPHFDVNPNSGEPEGAWTTCRPARNTVHAGPDRPSHVRLHVLPKR